MIESRETYHIVVVGGSFAGLAAAMQLGRARRRVLVVDAGKPRNRFTHASHGFLGQDGQSPTQILTGFRDQVLSYPTVRFHAGEATTARQADDGTFTVALASGEQVRAERLILATGVADELPSMPGIEERWGVTVLHCPYCHGYEVADRRIGVLATSDRAVHLAMLLPDWSADVTLFTNGAVDLSAEQQASFAMRGVRIEPRAVVELVGSAPDLEAVRLSDDQLVEVDALFIGTRTHMTSGLAEQLGCEFDDGPFGPVVRTDINKETTVPGVYCAGDAARTPHNATWAAADGATAGVSAHRSLVFPSTPSLAPRG